MRISMNNYKTLMYNKLNITKLLFLVLLSLLGTLSTAVAQVTIEKHPTSLLPFHTGDLLFVSDTTGMGAAIGQSTGRYTHVAIVVCENSRCLVYEALPKKGVIKTEYGQWRDALLQELSATTADLSMIVVCRRMELPFDTLLLLKKLSAYLGTPYDEYFLPDNGKLYCSELVYNCFYDNNGIPLFPSKPMNFKSPNGKFPTYWKQHFQQLGVEIPQGVLGTNPHDLFNSRFLHDVPLPD